MFSYLLVVGIAETLHEMVAFFKLFLDYRQKLPRNHSRDCMLLYNNSIGWRERLGLWGDFGELLRIVFQCLVNLVPGAGRKAGPGIRYA
jgi:hypothetical protein